METCEIGFVILCYHLFDQAVFRFRHLTVAPFPDKHNKVLQETDLLHIQLFTLNAERIHGDGVLFRIADILTSHIFAEPFVGIACIDHNNVCILFPKLADYTVHVEALAASAWAKAEKIRVVSQFFFPFLATDINGHGHALAVCIIDL